MALLVKPTRDPKVTRWWWRTLREWVYDLVDPLWAALRGENSADIALTNLTSLNGVSATELDYLADLSGPGIAVASKAIVLDANKDVTGKRFDVNRSLLDSVVGNGPCFRTDGIDDNITLTGAGSQLSATHGAIEIVFAAHDLDGAQFIYGVATPRVYVSLNGASLRITLGDNVSHNIQNIVTEAIYHVMLTWLDPDGDGDGTYAAYLNGVLADSGSYTGLTSIPPNPTLGSSSASSWAHCSIFKHRAFNRVLTSDEVAHFSSGIPVSFADIGASGADQTSGVLVVGKRYRIQTYVAGDDFTNVGAPSNATGIEFVATGTTPAVWSNASTLNRIGCVVQLEQDGIGNNRWYDKSGNGLHGTVSGATPLNLPIAYVNDAGHHMVEGSGSSRNVLRFGQLQFQPGSIPGTNLDIIYTERYNDAAITDAIDLIAGGSSGSFSLSSDGKTITLILAEGTIAAASMGMTVHDLNSSSTTELYFIDGLYQSGEIALYIRKRGPNNTLDWRLVLDAGDYSRQNLLYITSS